jgi:hypothetical protein
MTNEFLNNPDPELADLIAKVSNSIPDPIRESNHGKKEPSPEELFLEKLSTEELVGQINEIYSTDSISEEKKKMVVAIREGLFDGLSNKNAEEIMGAFVNGAPISELHAMAYAFREENGQQGVGEEVKEESQNIAA